MQGNHEHIIHLMEFSFKILDTIKQFNSDTFGTNFTMKIGFNYGPVTDGIIGQNKVITVNNSIEKQIFIFVLMI